MQIRTIAIALGATGGALAIGVACSSNDPPGTPIPDAGVDTSHGVDGGSTALNHAGSRIQLRGTETPDGAFVFETLFDTKLGIDCGIGPTKDGEERCVPGNVIPVGSFSDATCTKPIGNVGKGGCVTNTAWGLGFASSPTNPCDNKRVPYKLGAIINPAKVYSSSSGTCTEGVTDSAYDYYTVTEEPPVTDFVKFTRITVPLTAAISATVWEGDDGSRLQTNTFIDTARKQPCKITRGGDDKLRCVPQAEAQVNDRYSTSACADRVAVRAQCVVPYDIFDTTSATTFELDECLGAKLHAFPIATKRSTKDVYAQGAGDAGCTGPTASPSDVYDLGPEIPPASLPEIGTATTGGSQVALKTYLVGGAVVLTDSNRLTDVVQGQACFVDVGPDGKKHCFPIGPFSSYFSDDKCTVPLAVSSSTCTPAKYITSDQFNGCNRAQHVYQLGTKLDPITTPAWVSSNGTCSAIGGSSASTTYYTLGAEVPVSTFAEMKPATR